MKNRKNLVFFIIASLPLTSLAGLLWNSAVVTESGIPAIKAEGVKFLRMENDAAVYEVVSGCYSFCSEK